MHLNLRLPKVEPLEIHPPTRCPFRDRKHRNKKCPGTHFKAHQANCRKRLRDPKHDRVTAQRFRCLKCHRTFRAYPRGVSRDQQSDTLKSLSVLLYILGLSYQAVADLREALQYPLAKSTVYENVQAAGQSTIRLRRAWLRQLAGQVKVLGMDFTRVKCNGQEKIVAVATAVLTGQPLTFDLVQSESALHAQQWIHDLAHLVGAEILVTDAADGLKSVAEELGLQHHTCPEGQCLRGICRAHTCTATHARQSPKRSGVGVRCTCVNRNLHDLIATLGEKALEHPDPVPWELKTLDVSVDQFLEDLQTAEFVIMALPAHGQQQLEQLVERYQFAPPPSQGHKASMWYRFRRLVLDWSENWSRLTLFQRWRGWQQEKLDGTNNVTEQIMGQRVKERYTCTALRALQCRCRTMRGYKRDQSILNVSSLIGWLGMKGHENQLSALVTS